MVKKINEAEFRTEAVSGKVVVDFSATWCGPCQMLAPVLEEVSEEMADIKFFQVDVDESVKLAMEYGISSVPALLVLEDGVKTNMLVGFQPKAPLMDAIKASF